jgi:hypothetical protein
MLEGRENGPLSAEARMVARQRMVKIPKADIIGDFSGIVNNLGEVAKRMRRLQVLPPDMDLSGSMRAWNEEALGKAVIIKNEATGKTTLTGYILPVDNAFLILFSNGIIRKGEVADSTRSGSFEPSIYAWVLNEWPEMYDTDGELTDEVTRKKILKPFAENGLRVTLSNDNDADSGELRGFVQEALRQIEITRADRNIDIVDSAKTFTGVIEEILIKEAKSHDTQKPEPPQAQ